MNTFDKKYTYADARKSAEYFSKYKSQAKLHEEASQLQRDNDINDIRSYQNGIYKENFRKKQEHINSVLYTEEFNKGFLCEAFKRIISESLLVDEEQYKLLNENFETEIEKSVSKLLNSSNIDSMHLTEDMKVILSSAGEIMPSYEMYKELFEEYDNDENKSDDDAIKQFKVNAIYNKAFDNEKVKKAIDNISGEVRSQVADIVSAEQDKAEEDLSLISKINELNKEDQLARQVQADADSREVNAQAITSVNNDTQEIEKKTDPIVQENYSHGIVESIIINECRQMIAEGKEVNTDLALANAIQFLTIVEAFNATGLIKSNSETYNAIIKESGLYRQPKADMKLAQNIEHRFADIGAKSVPERKENEKPKSKVTKTFQQWKAEKEKNAAINASNKAENKAVKESVVQYTNDNTKFYTKTQLAMIFETIGYDLNRDDFDLIAESLGYKQIVK